MQKPVHRVEQIFILPEEKGTEGFSILAYGNTYTKGWSNIQLIPCFTEGKVKKGLYEFTLAATAPESQPLPVTTEVSAFFTFSPGTTNIKKIRVFAESNCIDTFALNKEGNAIEMTPSLLGVVKTIASSIATGILPANGTIKKIQTA